MPVLRARVDPETKELFLALAAAEGVTESILLRQLVQGAIGRRQEVRAPVAPDLEKLDMARLTIRMPQFLLEAAGQRAEVKGMASSRWISALVQSNLMREPVMSDREIETRFERWYGQAKKPGWPSHRNVGGGNRGTRRVTEEIEWPISLGRSGTSPRAPACRAPRFTSGWMSFSQ